MIYGPRRGGTWAPSSLEGYSSHWELDDAGYVTMSGADVVSVTDRGPASRIMEQPTADARRPTTTTRNGKTVMLCDATAGPVPGQFLYASSTTAADWKFLHDGTGGSLIAMFRRSGTAGHHTVASTDHAINAVAGFSYEANDENSLLTVDNSAGTAIATGNGISGSLPANTNHILVYRSQTSASPEWEMTIDNSVVASGSWGSTPSNTNSNNVLIWGIKSDATLPFTGELMALIVCTSRISDFSKARIYDYLHAKYG